MFLFALNPFLIASAVIPAVVLVIWIYRKDRLEKEPRALIWKLLLVGCLSTVIAGLLEELGAYAMNLFKYRSLVNYYAIFYFIVVGGAEECAKFFLMKKLTWYSNQFNCQFDGVVYAATTSLGFALLENIRYVISYGFGTALLRAVTAVPGHACFGIFMGAWYGVAKRYDNDGYPEKAKLCLFLSLFFSILLHGAYDFIATMESSGYTSYFTGFILLLFGASFFLVKRMSKKDRYIV